MDDEFQSLEKFLVMDSMRGWSERVESRIRWRRHPHPEQYQNIGVVLFQLILIQLFPSRHIDLSRVRFFLFDNLQKK